MLQKKFKQVFIIETQKHYLSNDGNVEGIFSKWKHTTGGNIEVHIFQH